MKKNSEKSDREIAKQVGVDHKIVSSQRKYLEATGEIRQFNSRTGKDGKIRKKPSKREHKAKPPTEREDAYETNSENEIRKVVGLRQ